jgi:hypothetical protein
VGVDERLDFDAAGAAIGAGVQCLADRFDRHTSVPHGGGDLVRSHIETGADCSSLVCDAATLPSRNHSKTGTPIGKPGT